MEKKIKVKDPLVVVFISIAYSFFASCATAIFTPSLPAITNYFQTSISIAQLSIILYLLILGIFQSFGEGFQIA